MLMLDWIILVQQVLCCVYSLEKRLQPVVQKFLQPTSCCLASKDESSSSSEHFVNKITDDKDIIKLMLSKQTKEDESDSDSFEKVSAEGETKRKNVESREKIPKDEHQDITDATLNKKSAEKE
nr:hypothetical protein [Tanacetum cinerariifolium]